MISDKNKTIKQFGLWESTITPIGLAKGLRFSDVAWDEDGTLLWRESRSGLSTIVVQTPDGQAPRALNNHYDVRAGVGYGGGDFCVGGGDVYFVEAASGRIFRQPTHKGVAKPITPAFGSAASPSLSPDGRFLIYVHSYEGKDCLGLVDVDGNSWPVKLVSGNDFYMQPCWHPDSRSIAWVAWNHPQMPWDGTELYLGALQEDEDKLFLGDVVSIAGGPDIAIFQPQFSPDGRFLAYVSDEEGWWQLKIHDLYEGEHGFLTHVEAEHGVPAWVQGLRTYGFTPEGNSVFFLRNQNASVSLWKVDVNTKTEQQVDIDPAYSWFNQVAVSPDGERVALLASGGGVPDRVITTDISGKTRVERRSLPENLPPEIYARPEPISWEGMDGGDVHGIYYAPQNPAYQGEGLPPLMVLIHGGPTSQRETAYDGQAQFFSSRGWAVLQVNYRGSTGYGRQYRDMLRGNWGIYDVQDSVSGVKHLVNLEKIDGDKAVIMGGSAGGFTVLKALEDYPGFFKAGICLYGVANQFTLVADTHKFEERYSDSLLGPLPAASTVYRERSPIFYASKIQDPIAVFQGEEDKVVPKSQSEEIVEALRRNGVPHEFHLYPGEGHGFRKEETIEAFYKAVDRFLRQYVIFT